MSELIGQVFLAETSNDTKKNNVNIVDVYDKNGVFYVVFDSTLHSFHVLNRNNRMYDKSNVEEKFFSPKNVDLLNRKSLYGEINHPLQEYVELHLTQERLKQVLPERRSHKITNPKFYSDRLDARIETASGTDYGIGFGKEIIQGLIPAFSCRSAAELRMVDDKPYVIINRLITYDWVWYPSHKEAIMISKPKGEIKKIDTSVVTLESCSDKFYINPENLSKDACISMDEIIKNAAKQDCNIGMVMESFELPEEAIKSYNRNLGSILLEDGENKIYVNASPRTARRIESFLTKF